MLKRTFAALGLAAAATAAWPAPPPPPAPAEQRQIDTFFAALPKRVPADDLARLEPLVAPGVEVYRNGQLVFSDRAAWFAELARNPFEGQPTSAVGQSISREMFYRGPEGEHVVFEFYYPVPPPGAQVTYHLAYPYRLVRYWLSDGILTKIDYGTPFENGGGPSAG